MPFRCVALSLTKLASSAWFGKTRLSSGHCSSRVHRAVSFLIAPHFSKRLSKFQLPFRRAFSRQSSIKFLQEPAPQLLRHLKRVSLVGVAIGSVAFLGPHVVHSMVLPRFDCSALPTRVLVNELKHESIEPLPLHYSFAHYGTLFILFHEHLNKIFEVLLLHAFKLAGPTFIKLGQWISTRPDLFSPALCVLMSDLRTHAPCHSISETKRIIAQDFGAEFDALFSDIVETPIGSGAIAQVHLARLKESSEEVAVKVLHPGVQAGIRKDLHLLQSLSRALAVAYPSLRWLALEQALQQFSDFMEIQLDMRVEAANLHQFRENFSARRYPVCFPSPHPSLVAPRVLVESYEPGVSLDECLSTNILPSTLRHHIALAGMRSLLTMIFDHNFIHSDLHPGNILIRFPKKNRLFSSLFSSTPPAALSSSSSLSSSSFPFDKDDCDEEGGTPPTLSSSPSTTSSPSPSRLFRRVFDSFGPMAAREIALLRKKLRRKLHKFFSSGQTCPVELVLLDAGLITKLTPRDRHNFQQLVTAVAQGDGRAAAMSMLVNARQSSASQEDADMFVEAVSGIFQKLTNGQSLSLDHVNFGTFLRAVLDEVQKYRIMVEGNFASLVVSLIVLEGVGRQLNPHLNIISVAQPFLFKRHFRFRFSAAKERKQQ